MTKEEAKKLTEEHWKWLESLFHRIYVDARAQWTRRYEDKLLPVKICDGCPDRFEGCVKLADDQTQGFFVGTDEYARGYNQCQQDMLKAGWRKVELEVKDGRYKA